MIVEIKTIKGDNYILPLENIILICSRTKLIEDALYNEMMETHESPLYRPVQVYEVYTLDFYIEISKEEYERVSKIYKENYAS